MYTIKQIIDNQNKFKNLIVNYLNKEYNESKKNLFKIKSDDKYINEQVDKLKNKFKKKLYKKEIDRLFFLNTNRSENFYLWWDEQQEEAIILKYDKK